MSRLPDFMHTRAWVDSLFAASWLGVGAALWFGVVQRAIHERREAGEQQALVAQLEDEAAQGARQLAAKRVQSAALEKQLASMTLRLLPSGALNQRLGQLTALASEVERAAGAKFKLEQITPGEPVRGARSTAVPIRLTGSAGYGEAADLLARLRAAFPDTGVSGFSVARSVEDPGAVGAFRMDLVWYAAPGGPGEGAP